jgi:lipoprotein LprG
MASLRALVGAAAASAVLLSGCTGSAPGDERSPEEVLADAKETLDGTSGVGLRLATDDLPEGVDGIIHAEGVGTHDPAFEGDLEVLVGGVSAEVPVVAAEGKVVAKLPFTTRFVEVDPASYAAPDPAALMDPDSGLSSLLTAAQGVETGEQVRSGKDVLAGFSGTVPGSAVAAIIPSASADTDFDATFTVDEDDRLREVVLTGPFYPDAAEVTYTVTFDDYDTDASITLP